MPHHEPAKINRGAFYQETSDQSLDQKFNALDSVNRVPADDIEKVVGVTVSQNMDVSTTEWPEYIHDPTGRVDIHQTQTVLTLSMPGADEPKTVTVPWTKPIKVMRRQILEVKRTPKLSPFAARQEHDH